MSFENFTNLYELSKTLRFELKPIGETGKLLEEHHIIALDKARKDAYETTKPYFNTLHLEFVNTSLSKANLVFDPYLKAYKNYLKDKKNKKTQKEKKDTEQNLRKEVEMMFDQGAKIFLKDYSEIAFKKQDKDFLYEKGVFELLKEKFKDDANIYKTNPKT